MSSIFILLMSMNFRHSFTVSKVATLSQTERYLHTKCSCFYIIKHHHLNIQLSLFLSTIKRNHEKSFERSLLFSAFIDHQAIPLGKVLRVINGTSNIVLPSRTIRLLGGPQRVAGQHGYAIKLNGKAQYLDLGTGTICGGNLDTCSQVNRLLKKRPQTNYILVKQPKCF